MRTRTRTRTRIPSFFLSVVLIVGLCPAPAFAGDIAAAESPALSLSTQSAAHTQAEAVAWVNSQANAATAFGDGECVWLTFNYYQYLGQAGPYGNANQYGNGGSFCPAGWSLQDRGSTCKRDSNI